MRHAHQDRAIHRGLRPVWLLLVFLVLLAPTGCGRRPAAETTANSPAYPREDLLIGYDLLANTLSDESRLGTLDLYKKLTLRGPVEEIDQMMKTLSEASKRRASELKKLRHLEPDVSDKPTADSPIGDAIAAVAKESGSYEMTNRSGGFDIRFVLLQAQATRMVAAMATATARFDPNPERKAWLESLALEYEVFRSNLIQVAEKYVAGKGDAQ